MNTKTARLILMTCLLLVLIVSVYGCKSIAADEDKQDIADGLTIKSKDLYGYSTEGGRLTAAYANETLVYMQAQFYGETGNKKETYFFTDDTTIIEYITTLYSNPIGIEPISYREITVEKYVYENEELFTWDLEDNSLTAVKDIELRDQILGSLDRYFEELTATIEISSVL